jgi:predicted alpha/beta-fold hydrolase
LFRNFKRFQASAQLQQAQKATTRIAIVNSQTERLTLTGTAGAIEALRDAPQLVEGQSPKGVAIIAHPHPLFGGTMDNKVVQTLARAFVQCGYTVVRFNFRGVGASAGEYDAGKAELQDLLAVVQQVAPEGPWLWPAFPSALSSPAMRWPNSGVQAGCRRPCWSAPPPAASRWRPCLPRPMTRPW